MVSNPLVSVVMPCFNAQKFIREAVESVVAQTYANWELLIIDDGSTDGSSDIALSYTTEERYKIKCLTHEGRHNRGACPSRNLGIANAHGDYIALLDADDVWFPKKLEEQVGILQAHPEVGMVYGSCEYCYCWTGDPDDRSRDWIPQFSIEPDSIIKPPRLLVINFPLGASPSPCPSNVLLRRSVVERIHGFEDAWVGKLQLYEDQAFLSKVYVDTAVYVTDTCWARYRQHPASCVSIVESAGEADVVRRFYLEWLEKYLLEHRVEDSDVWKALREALRPYRHPYAHRLTRMARMWATRADHRISRMAEQLLPGSIRDWLRATKHRLAHRPAREKA